MVGKRAKKRSYDAHRQSGCVVIVAGASVGIPLLIALFWIMSQRTEWRGPTPSSLSKNNLRNMALAVHNYLSQTEGIFPTGGTFSENGELRHSWQTAILPYIDQAVLYERVDPDLAWNDPRQGELFRIKIGLYQNPVLDGPEFVEGFAASHYAANKRLLLRNRPLRAEDVTDGLSCTLLLGEVGNGFRPWGDPTNVRDPADGIGTGPYQFGRPDGGVALFAYADGHVRVTANDIDPAVLRALATPDGGEVVDDF